MHPIRDYRYREPKSLGTNVPKKILRLYNEVILTFNAKFEILCASGIRAVIEGICNDQGVEKGQVIEYDKQQEPKRDKNGEVKKKYSSNLDGKIEGLVVKGILSQKNAGSLHQLRFIGNEAVHQLERPSEDELRLAIEIIENTLESIYEIARKGDELEKHKSARKNQPTNVENQH